MCRIIRTPACNGNEASGSALPGRETLGCEDEAVVCPTMS